jgi:hypothetical protein
MRFVRSLDANTNKRALTAADRVTSTANLSSSSSIVSTSLGFKSPALHELMFSLLAQLFCCGVRPRAAPLDVQSTVCIGAPSVFSELSPSSLIVFGPQVIPNEHSRLLDDPSSYVLDSVPRRIHTQKISLSETRRPDIVVDHQTLSDRLENIVRAKEGYVAFAINHCGVQ